MISAPESASTQLVLQFEQIRPSDGQSLWDAAMGKKGIESADLDEQLSTLTLTAAPKALTRFERLSLGPLDPLLQSAAFRELLEQYRAAGHQFTLLPPDRLSSIPKGQAERGKQLYRLFKIAVGFTIPVVLLHSILPHFGGPFCAWLESKVVSSLSVQVLCVVVAVWSLRLHVAGVPPVPVGDTRAVLCRISVLCQVLQRPF